MVTMLSEYIERLQSILRECGDLPVMRKETPNWALDADVEYCGSLDDDIVDVDGPLIEDVDKKEVVVLR